MSSLNPVSNPPMPDVQCGVCGQVKRWALTGHWRDPVRYSVPGTHDQAFMDVEDERRMVVERTAALCGWRCAGEFLRAAFVESGSRGWLTCPRTLRTMELPEKARAAA